MTACIFLLEVAARGKKSTGDFALARRIGDPLLRPMKYLALCESAEDDAACLAVENGSAFAPLLAPEVIEQGRSVRGARALPDQAAALDVAQDLRALLASAVAAARRHMSVGPTRDPLLVANLGD